MNVQEQGKSGPAFDGSLAHFELLFSRLKSRKALTFGWKCTLTKPTRIAPPYACTTFQGWYAYILWSPTPAREGECSLRGMYGRCLAPERA